MPFSYNEWVKNVLFPMFVRRGINATLSDDGDVICEKNGYIQITKYEDAYTKYKEYLAKYGGN
jgi:hypothetical protein